MVNGSVPLGQRLPEEQERLDEGRQSRRLVRVDHRQLNQVVGDISTGTDVKQDNLLNQIRAGNVGSVLSLASLKKAEAVLLYEDDLAQGKQAGLSAIYRGAPVPRPTLATSTKSPDGCAAIAYGRMPTEMSRPVGFTFSPSTASTVTA